MIIFWSRIYQKIRRKEWPELGLERENYPIHQNNITTAAKKMSPLSTMAFWS